MIQFDLTDLKDIWPRLNYWQEFWNNIEIFPDAKWDTQENAGNYTKKKIKSYEDSIQWQW